MKAAGPAAGLGGEAGCIGRWQPSSVTPPGGGVRPAGRDAGGPARPGAGQEPAVGGGQARRLGRSGSGLEPVTAGAAAPVGDRAVHRARTGPDRRDAADAAHEPAVPGPGGSAAAGSPADAPLPRERAKAPYTPAEIDGYLALAAAQPTAARRMRAAGLVGLGAGAGLIRADLRAVRGTDITARSGGVIVQVSGEPAAGGAGAGPLPRDPARGGAVRRPGPGHRRHQPAAA